jgi:tetratricopeptide (TPR) repeat protein
MRRWLSGGMILLIFIFIQINCQAQSGNDAVNQKDFEIPDSLAFARNLRAQALDSINVFRYQSAEILLQKAFGIAGRFGELKLANNIMNNLAECYSCTGRHQLAVDTYLDLLGRVSQKNDTASMASVLINLGDEYAKAGKLELAVETELQAIRLKEQSRNLTKLAYYYQKLGELFSASDPLKWEFYINKALQISRNPEQTTWYADIAIYNDLGAIWSKKGDYSRASAYYDTMYRLSVDAEYPNGINTATSERALMFFEQGRYTEALPLARQAFEVVKDGEGDYKFAYSSTLLASVLIKLNRAGVAISLLEPALNRARQAKLTPEVLVVLKKITDAYEMNGRWDRAFSFQKQWISLKDSLDGVQIRQTMNEMQTRFETEKKQQLINRLSEQNKVQKQLTNRLTGVLAVSGFALLLLIFLARLRNRTIRQNKALHQQEQKIMLLENERLTQNLEFKSRELTAATVHLINKNEVLNELKGSLTRLGDKAPDLNQMVRKIKQNLNLDNDWDNFRRHFEDVHPDFFARLKSKFPALTPHEERLCAYLRINLNTKEISNMLNVTTAAVDKGRNRLRKKLDIAPEVNLTEFIAAI